MEKEDFVNYRALVLEVRQLRKQLTVLEGSIYSPKGQRFSHTPRSASGQNRTMDDVAAAHIALEEKYRTALAEQEARQLAIEEAIQSLENPVHRLIMRHRYIDGMGWRRICEKLRARGYSERQVYRFHGEALLRLKEV